jgi:hypothetical protein
MVTERAKQLVNRHAVVGIALGLARSGPFMIDGQYVDLETFAGDGRVSFWLIGGR